MVVILLLILAYRAGISHCYAEAEKSYVHIQSRFTEEKNGSKLLVSSRGRRPPTPQGIKKVDFASAILYHPTVSCFPRLDFLKTSWCPI